MDINLLKIIAWSGIRLVNKVDLVSYKKRIAGYLSNMRQTQGGASNSFEPTVSTDFYTDSLVSIKHKRVVLFASYTGNGRIPSYTIFFLQKLKQYSDAIYFCCDSPLLQSEIEKISKLCRYVYFGHHGEYDFGSYKRAWEAFKKDALVEKIDQVLLANDSIVGPNGNLSEFFDQFYLDGAPDLYGLTINNFGYDSSSSTNLSKFSPHIQSYFVLLAKRFFTSEVWDSFITSVHSFECKTDIIINYEMGLSKLATENGFRIGSFYKGGYLNPAANNFIELFAKCFFVKTSQIKRSPQLLNYLAEEKKFPFRFRSDGAYSLEEYARSVTRDYDRNIVEILGINCLNDEEYTVVVRTFSFYRKALRMVLQLDSGNVAYFSEEFEPNTRLLKDIKTEQEVQNTHLHFFSIHCSQLKNLRKGKLYFTNLMGEKIPIKWYCGKHPKKYDLLTNYYVAVKASELKIFKSGVDFLLSCASLLDYVYLFIYGVIRLLGIKTFLFAEKGSLLADNAYQLYQYSKKIKNISKERSFYVTDINAVDSKKTKDNCLVNFNSFKHKIVFLSSAVVIYSFDELLAIPDGISDVVLSFMYKSQKWVLASHGYTGGHNNSCMTSRAVRGNIDLVLACTEFEEKNFLRLGFDNVKYTGYPRMDKWYQCSIDPKMITIFFTFRRSLLRCTNIEFINSDYYKSAIYFVRRLVNLKPESKIFYILHNALNKTQKQLLKAELLGIAKNIIVIDNDNEENMNQALQSCNLFITDISSVGFDMIYKGSATVIFYVDSTFLQGHYEVNNSFVKQIELSSAYIVKNIEEMEPLLKGNSRTTSPDQLFKFTDNNNSQRVMSEIQKLV